MNPSASWNPPAIDLTVKVTTPENIEFDYRLAGPFRRLNAFFFDLFMRAATLFALFLLFMCSGVSQIFPAMNIAPEILMTLLYFFFDWFYGLIFETLWNGKTPGKAVSGLRVISTNGRPISAYQATIRNFLRFGDLAPFVSLELMFSEAPPAYVIPTGAVALACMFLSKRFQRLGDLAAGTMVVVDDLARTNPKIKWDEQAIVQLVNDIPPNFRLSRNLLRTIASYVTRRRNLAKNRRTDLASLIAPALLEQTGLPPSTNPDHFLCALYIREFEMRQTPDLPSTKNASSPPPTPPQPPPNENRRTPRTTKTLLV